MVQNCSELGRLPSQSMQALTGHPRVLTMQGGIADIIGVEYIGTKVARGKGLSLTAFCVRIWREKSERSISARKF